MNTVFVALGFFAIILALLVALRVKSGNKIDIRSSDIVLALVPVALWLFLTGKIQEFAFGEVKIVAAIKMAAKAPVGPQVSKLTVDTVRERITTMSKAGPEVIPQMIDTKSQALSFTLGPGRLLRAGDCAIFGAAHAVSVFALPRNGQSRRHLLRTRRRETSRRNYSQFKSALLCCRPCRLA